MERVGRQARRIRGKRSAKWLSDQTELLGMRISPTVIAKLDSGHRGANLSVPELFVLAGALNVSPVSLLFPDLPDGEVRRLPNEHPMRSVTALGWVGGSDFASTVTRRDGEDWAGPGTEREHQAWRLLALADTQDTLMEHIADVESRMENNSDDPERVEVDRALMKNLYQAWEQNQAFIKEVGGVLRGADDDG